MALLRDAPDDPLSFLPTELRRELELFCTLAKERPEDVIVDALTLHSDALHGGVAIEPEQIEAAQ